MAKDDLPAGDSATANMNPGDEASPGTPGTGEDICPACAGRGRRDGHLCEECSGTGIVTEGIGGG